MSSASSVLGGLRLIIDIMICTQTPSPLCTITSIPANRAVVYRTNADGRQVHRENVKIAVLTALKLIPYIHKNSAIYIKVLLLVFILHGEGETESVKCSLAPGR